MRRPRLGIAAGVVMFGTVLLQFAGPARTNPIGDPAMRLEAQSPVPAHVAATLRRACYDCHSNETRWPWYSRIAPISWLVVNDVNHAREELNFSDWGAYNEFDRADMLDEACEQASKGKMPLPQYVLVHRGAKLSAADVEALCAWTRAEASRLMRPN